jgi:hypothetical protein
MAEERLWCTACGTVTRDSICDCNRWHNEMSREPHFVNYADAMQEAAHERAQQIEALVEALHGLIIGAPCEVNEKGAGGFMLARLSDAKKVLGEVAPDRLRALVGTGKQP